MGLHHPDAAMTSETVWDEPGPEGVSGMAPSPISTPMGSTPKSPGEVKAQPRGIHGRHKTARTLGRYCQFALAASKQALAQSGLARRRWTDDVGVMSELRHRRHEEIEKSTRS